MAIVLKEGAVVKAQVHPPRVGCGCISCFNHYHPKPAERKKDYDYTGAVSEMIDGSSYKPLEYFNDPTDGE